MFSLVQIIFADVPDELCVKELSVLGVAKPCPGKLRGWELMCNLNLNSTCPGQKAQGGPGAARTRSRDSGSFERVFLPSVVGKG